MKVSYSSMVVLFCVVFHCSGSTSPERCGSGQKEQKGALVKGVQRTRYTKAPHTKVPRRCLCNMRRLRMNQSRMDAQDERETLQRTAAMLSDHNRALQGENDALRRQLDNVRKEQNAALMRQRRLGQWQRAHAARGSH